VTRQATIRAGVSIALESDYGDRGNRQTLTATSPVWASARQLTLGVDTLGRPDRIGDVTGQLTKVTYNQDHRPATLRIPTNGLLTQYFSYGANDRLAGVAATAAPEVLNWAYGYDALNRIETQTQGVENASTQRSVQYDAAGRLTRWTDVRTTLGAPYRVCSDPYDLSSCYWTQDPVMTTQHDSSYTWDAVGNPTVAGSSAATGNRLTSHGGYAMTYDADGNVLSKTGSGVSQTFTWNSLGQLTAVTTNGVQTTFGYDGLGRRVRKTHAGVTTRYLYDGDDLVMQVDASSQPVLEFSYYPGIDRPHAMRSAATGAIYYYTVSQPGHVTALVNGQQQVVNQYEYTPFGAPLATTEGVAQPFQFTARQRDPETGLYYYRARYFDPSLGRFISEDPIGLAGGVNQFAYVGNDPMNQTDPFGLCPPEQLVIETGKDGKLRARCKNGSAIPTLAGMNATTDRWPFGTPAQSGVNSNRSGRGAMEAWAARQALQSPPAYADPVSWLSGGLVGSVGRVGATGVISASELTVTKTVAKSIGSRPYLNSTLLLRELMRSARPIRDPGGVAGALRWDVPGAFRGSPGAWELVVNPNTKEILHFLFKSY
jgi:RHS repeat-associated protein